ncbi:MAG: response regulator transcription factor [Planctomycetota bacterium]|nr:MAG: response regulator transcription factor [Planctomycetota bacterium]
MTGHGASRRHRYRSNFRTRSGARSDSPYEDLRTTRAGDERHARLVTDQGLKLIIVYDDPEFRPYIRRDPELGGIECDAAEDAERGLGPAGAGCDMILLDVMMPGKIGWDFRAELRARGDATPVIFLTARVNGTTASLSRPGGTGSTPWNPRRSR